MNVSFIIPTYNNSKLLSRTLKSFCKLVVNTNIEWEIVIVNNNCSDDTDHVVNLFSGELPLKLVQEKKQGTSFAKNTGIVNSSGKLVIFTDDDVRMETNWLDVYWDAYREMQEGYFWGGPVVSDFESESPSAELMVFAPPSVTGLSFGNQRKILTNDKYFIGVNWACPRKALDDVGFFNIDMGLGASGKQVRVGEETDLMRRLRKKGYRGFYLPEAKNYHFVPAAKTTLEHIASREEAHAYYVATRDFIDVNPHSTPIWPYIKLVQSWVKWKFNAFLMKSCIEEYIFYRRATGVVHASFDHRK